MLLQTLWKNGVGLGVAGWTRHSPFSALTLPWRWTVTILRAQNREAPAFLPPSAGTAPAGMTQVHPRSPPCFLPEPTPGLRALTAQSGCSMEWERPPGPGGTLWPWPPWHCPTHPSQLHPGELASREAFNQLLINWFLNHKPCVPGHSIFDLSSHIWCHSHRCVWPQSVTRSPK